SSAAAIPLHIYPLSLHDALPILMKVRVQVEEAGTRLSLQEARLLQEISDRPANGEFRVRLDLRKLSEPAMDQLNALMADSPGSRSEEHTSELQSPYDLVCSLLLE